MARSSSLAAAYAPDRLSRGQIRPSSAKLVAPHLAAEPSGEPENPVDDLLFGACRGEVVERPVGHADDRGGDERSAFGGGDFGMLQAILPSYTAQPPKSYSASFEKICLKSTCPSPSERSRAARFSQGR